MGKPIVYGPRYSVYTRAVLMALTEKKAAFEEVHVEQATEEHKAPEHVKRHPFGLLPAFEHNGFMIYETVPILQYVEEAFPGVRLTPADIHRRTRMAQILAVINAYTARPLVWGVFALRAYPTPGRPVDEAAIAEKVKVGIHALKAIEDLMVNPDPFLVGRQISLADMLLEPMLFYLDKAPEAPAMLAEVPKIAAWHAAMQSVPTVVATRPKALLSIDAVVPH
jgi:glutathione S-transferase